MIFNILIIKLNFKDIVLLFIVYNQPVISFNILAFDDLDVYKSVYFI